MHTGRRNQLHLSQVEQFAAWAEDHGYSREPVKGDYEILRLRKKGKVEPPLLLWEYNGGAHATTNKRSQVLVGLWFRERNQH